MLTELTQDPNKRALAIHFGNLVWRDLGQERCEVVDEGTVLTQYILKNDHGLSGHVVDSESEEVAELSRNRLCHLR